MVFLCNLYTVTRPFEPLIAFGLIFFTVCCASCEYKIDSVSDSLGARNDQRIYSVDSLSSYLIDSLGEIYIDDIVRGKYKTVFQPFDERTLRRPVFSDTYYWISIEIPSDLDPESDDWYLALNFPFVEAYLEGDDREEILLAGSQDDNSILLLDGFPISVIPLHDKLGEIMYFRVLPKNHASIGHQEITGRGVSRASHRAV